MPHRAAQQDRAAAPGNHRLIGGDEVLDQLVVEQIVRRLRKRNDADLAVDFMSNCSSFVSSRFVDCHRSRLKRLAFRAMNASSIRRLRLASGPFRYVANVWSSYDDVTTSSYCQL